MKRALRFLGVAVFLLAAGAGAGYWITAGGAGSHSALVLAEDETDDEDNEADFEMNEGDMDVGADDALWHDAAVESDVGAGNSVDTESSGNTESSADTETSEPEESASGRTSSVYRDRTRGAAKSESAIRRPDSSAQGAASGEEKAYKYETGYIFMGDSRFYLMNLDCGIDSRENFFVVACPGMGYSWMIMEAIPKITSIRETHPEIENWVIISGLGINDLENVKSYLDTYKVLSKNTSLVLLSVNPISKPVEWGYTNGTIDAFNDRLQSLASRNRSIKYINCHDYLVHKGYATTDGVHYDSATNYDIYVFILNSLSLTA